MFAGRDRWAVGVFAGAAAAATLFARPTFDRSHRLVDAAVVAWLVFAAVQLVPLPPVLRLAFSPSSAAIDRAVLLAPSDPSQAPWHPLTLDSASTGLALAQAVGVALTFWLARGVFERGGALRLTLRGIVWFGLALAVVTFVQRAVSPHLFYGIWTPVARTDRPAPLGPFLNRNDLATWLALAVPLTAGYAMARVESRTFAGDASRLGQIGDSRMAVAVASLALMAALLLASASRSGIVGCAAGGVALLALGRRRTSARQFAWLLAAMAVVAAVSTAYVNMPMLAARFGEVFAPDLGRGRIEIWRQTWPLARDFWRTGVGFGAFEYGMIVYQQRPFELFINHAHNQYLQFLVEGGVPLLAIALFAGTAGLVEAARRLGDDRTPVWWMRAGAVAAVTAVAVQSIWDAGLRMPANGALLAVVAAVALHGNERTSS